MAFPIICWARKTAVTDISKVKKKSHFVHVLHFETIWSQTEKLSAIGHLVASVKSSLTLSKSHFHTDKKNIVPIPVSSQSRSLGSNFLTYKLTCCSLSFSLNASGERITHSRTSQIVMLDQRYFLDSTQTCWIWISAGAPHILFLGDSDASQCNHWNIQHGVWAEAKLSWDPKLLCWITLTKFPPLFTDLLCSGKSISTLIIMFISSNRQRLRKEKRE